MQETKSFDQMEGGWEGDWTRGERPPGYLRTKERIQYLDNFGLDLTAVLGNDFKNEYFQILDQAKNGVLDSEQLKELLRCNKIVSDALDQFDASISEEDKKMFEDIRATDNFDELMLVLKRKGGIQGNSEFFSADKLEEKILALQRFASQKRKIDTRVLPRAFGLRKKVEILLGLSQ